MANCGRCRGRHPIWQESHAPRLLGKNDQTEGGEGLKAGVMAWRCCRGRRDWSRWNSWAEGEFRVGQEVIVGDEWDAQEESLDCAQCLQCHEWKGGDPDGAGSGGISRGLGLNGCGSAGWLVDFLRDPGAKRFCGTKNVVLSFDAERLPEADLKILVPWMRGEWQGKTGVKAHPAAP